VGRRSLEADSMGHARAAAKAPSRTLRGNSHPDLGGPGIVLMGTRWHSHPLPFWRTRSGAHYVARARNHGPAD
jgi:hypothetical protein